ncbi:MAG: ATP-binding protein [Chloroflexi bacterium]|nr:ATP-binding protein [Chloroflexota bacterium]
MLFFLLVIACSQGSLFLAFGHRSRFPLEQSTQRYVIATAALVMVWLVMMGAAVVALYAELDANQFMPPLERLAHALTLLLLGWAFLSADFIRWRSRSNLFIFGSVFLLTLLFINTARSWLLEYGAGLAFNAGEYAPLWSAVTGCLAAALLLLTALNTRHIVDAPLKALLFLLFVAGSAWELWQIAQGQVAGNYQGAARLAYASGLILLPVIIHRLAIALLENSLVEVVLAASQQAAAVPAEAPDGTEFSPRDGLSLSSPVHDSPRLLAAIGVMLERDSPADATDRVVQAVQSAVAAEVCLLLRLPNDSTADVVAGWDASTQKSLAAAKLDLGEQPTLLAAAKRGDMTTLLPDHHTDELHDLFQRIGVDGLSSMLVQPVLARGELVGVLLVGSPYDKVDLNEADRALLAEIAAVAAFLLAGQGEDGEKPQPDAASSAVDSSDRLRTDAPAHDVMLTIRHELTAGLAGSAERIASLRLQIGGLKKQLADEQRRLLDRLAESDVDASAAVGLRGAFIEQSALLSACETSASDLLDAETALRLLNGSDTLEQSIHEYLHKQYNRRLNSRDKLRRQISDLMVLRRSTPGDALSTILQQLQDEHDQLALQRDQQRRRQESIAQRLETLGATDINATMLPALVHLHAERLAFGKLQKDADARHASLQAEHQSLLDAGAGDKQELEAQLKQLSADHESLLESREALRREQENILAQTEAAEAATSALENDKQVLETTLAEERAHQIETQDQIQVLVEERDNLLTIRDQLTAKVAELLDDDSAREQSVELQNELNALRESVDRLSQQREDLALDLSDARLELAHAPEPPTPTAQTSTALLSLLKDLSAPIGSVRDYVDMLLAESIGILGAAQLQVLRLAAAENETIANLLAELQQAASADAGRRKQRGGIDIAGIIEEVIADTSPRVADKSLLIELSLDDNLPPLDANCLGVKHMLTLLMANACDVSPPGTQVLVSASKGDIHLNDSTGTIDALEIRVHDAGGGIANSDLPRIFARTYRAEYPAISGFGDNGVGITVARAIARAHEGDIWVTSEKGKGSTFHLALPLQSTAAAEV